jgi:hypothetical protein
VHSQITGANIDCSEFAQGTAQTLEHLVYASKGVRISGVTPPEFYYWVKVKRSSGVNKVVITQSIQGPGRKLIAGLGVRSGTGVYSLDGGTCMGVSNTVGQDPRSGSVTFTFNAGKKTGSTIYIAVNFAAAFTLAGMPIPPAGQKVVYRYSVSPGSSSEVDLIPG